jgi:hypothetical protein
MGLLDKLRAQVDTNPLSRENREIIDDIPGWYRDCLGLRVAPPKNVVSETGDPVGWVDMTPNSAYLNRIAFWRSSWEIKRKTGAFIFMDMEPRDSGKSIVMLAESARLCVPDRNFLIAYGAQNETAAGKRTAWFDRVLTSPEIVNRFGAFKGKGKKWNSEEKYFVGSKHKDQPNIALFSPGGTITGWHPQLWVFDDMVDRRNAKSFLLQEQVNSIFNDIIQARDTGTMIWIIGTPWPGIYHLYDRIADKFGKRAVIRYVPTFGPAVNQHGKRLFSEPGKQNYPWITEAFLEDQRQILPEDEYIGSYEVKRTHAKKHFRLSSFSNAEPPKTNNEPLAPYNLNRHNGYVYVLTDPANNKGGQRGLSKAAIAVFIKYSNGHSYILDMRLEHMTSTVFLDEFQGMVDKWGPIEHFVMENQGPGNMYPEWIEERYANREKEPPTIRPTTRTGGGTKEARIMTLYQPLSEGKLHFAPTVHPDIISWQDHSAIPLGLIPGEAQRFNPNGNKDSFDGLDCLADAYLTDKEGPLCPPPEFMPAEQPKQQTPEEVRMERLREGIREWREGANEEFFMYR